MVSSVPTSSISVTLQSQLNRLRRLNTQDIQSGWQICAQDILLADIVEISDATLSQQPWTIAALNERQHVAWEKGLCVRWLYQTIVVPSDLKGYPLAGLCLRLALTWWAEDAQIYINGHLVQSGDLFECFTRICVSEQVSPSQGFRVAIRLVSPEHDSGALVRSHLIYELPAAHRTPEPSFVADELAVLATLEPRSQKQIENEIAQLNWSSLQISQSGGQPSDNSELALWQTLSKQPGLMPAAVHPFQQSLSQLRRNLKPLSSKLKARTIQYIEIDFFSAFVIFSGDLSTRISFEKNCSFISKVGLVDF